MGLAGPARLSSGPLSSPKALSCSVDMQSSPKPSCQAERAFRNLSSICWAHFLPQSSASLLYANQQWVVPHFSIHSRLDFPVSSQKPALPLCSASWLENPSSKNMWGLERWPTCPVLSKDPCCVPSTHTEWLTTACGSSSRGSNASSDLCMLWHACGTHTDIQACTCTHKVN